MITVTELLSRIRTYTKIPTGQLSDDRLLDIASDVLHTNITPDVISTHENFYKQVDSYTIDNDTTTYRFPIGAIGGGLLDVLYKTTSDSEDYDELRQYEVSNKAKRTWRLGFILNSGGLEIWPKPNSTYYLEIHYLLRPGILTKSINTATVSSVDSDNNTIELSSLPSTITSTVSVDAMKSDGLNERVLVNASIDSISGSTLTINSSYDVSTVSVGDTVALSGYAPFVQIPREYIRYYLALIAESIAQITGDDRIYNMAQNDIKKGKPSVMNAINPRVSEEVSSVTIEW